MKDWRHYWKSIAAFIGAVITNAAADWMKNGAPIPESWGDGARWLLSIAAATWIVYQSPANAPKADAPEASG